MTTVDGRAVRYTWGLMYRQDNTVAMFNLPKEEAKRLESASGGTLICCPISTKKYAPNSRGLEKGVINGC
jgi:hypothetical protein